MRSLHYLFALTLVMAGTGVSSASPERSEAGALDAVGARLGRRATPDTVEQLLRRHPDGPVPIHPRDSNSTDEFKKRAHAPHGSRDHAFSKRMAHQKLNKGIVKKIRARRYEGDAVEKRWIQGPSIIQDSTPTDGLPPPGANINYFNCTWFDDFSFRSTALPSGTGGGGPRLVPPTFAPLPTPNLPLLGLNTIPAAFQSASDSFKLAPVPTTTPSAVELQLAAASPTPGRIADASAAAAIGGVLKNVLDVPVASPTAIAQNAKRWVWGSSIIQDDSPSSGLPDPAGGNVNNFPGYGGSSMGGGGGGPPILTPPTFPVLPGQASNGANALDQAANHFPSLSLSLSPSPSPSPSSEAPIITSQTSPAPVVVPISSSAAPPVTPPSSSSPPIIPGSVRVVSPQDITSSSPAAVPPTTATSTRSVRVNSLKPKTTIKAAEASGLRPTTIKAAVRTQVVSNKVAKREEIERQIKELQRRVREMEEEVEGGEDEDFEAVDEIVLEYEYDEVPAPEDEWHEAE
ncbi:BZ3500_MvSof-1268-A1-R1_Chr3-3g06550 [Microbotryum saponariae]|uniref:BZ3500_MvSof-1268-A1-R1_Chr3-3g06550 protein n=1 Tax=Microbotryum saponariae TaxID=289078 RepID=A0A2X0NH92_9BASI|nr:BZ3500_MvSof-1268-A1-R1_Chr3-3g06550 [Microbotryum saponariae]SDA04517.1 BZ3501_MvSof-1269-A2-R1_Chr3-2g06237 [Microbotryum saponariae]